MKGLTFGLVLAFVLVAATSVQAQEKTATDEKIPVKEMWLKKKEDFKFDIRMMVQLWSLYSMDQEIYNAETGEYEGVDNRLNTNLRRRGSSCGVSLIHG